MMKVGPTNIYALATTPMDDDEVKSGYLAICWFTTLSALFGNNILYTDHLENHQKQLLDVFEG